VSAASDPAAPIPTSTNEARIQIGPVIVIAPAHPISVVIATGQVNGLRSPVTPVPIPPPSDATIPVSGSTAVIDDAARRSIPRMV